MIDTGKATAIAQDVADQLSVIRGIDTDSIAVTLKKARRGRSRTVIDARGKSKQMVSARSTGFQFKVEFAVGGAKVTEGFFIPEDADPCDYSISGIVAYVAEGV